MAYKHISVCTGWPISYFKVEVIKFKWAMLHGVNQ